MKIFVSAAEISSDLQAEKILSALIALHPPGSVLIAGIGGPKLRSIPGFQCVQEAETLRAMGFAEVLSKMKVIRAAMSTAVEFIENFKPDLILTFDYPDFHLRLLKQIHGKPALKNTLKICGIPPKVWVWRAHRIEKIRTYYDAVWVIFPFEEKLYRDHGVPVIYAGNPLIADLLQEWPSPHGKQVDADGPLHLAVLPGSRDAELKYHLPVIPETLAHLSTLTQKKIIAEVPVPEGLSIQSFESQLKNTDQVSYLFSQGNSAEVLSRNSLGLIKSGTSTLEAAVLGCAPVIFYKTSKTTEWIFQYLIRYSGPVGLPNILLGVKKRANSFFLEFLGPEASPEALASALAQTWKSDPFQLQAQGKALGEMLAPYPNVPRQAALLIQKFLHHPPARPIVRESKVWIGLVSFVWSLLNGCRRFLHQKNILKTEEVKTRSVLVGNLQAGGAGKTPVVIEIAKRAVQLGHKVGVVSRAYGSKSKNPVRVIKGSELPRWTAGEIGDEPYEILSEVSRVTLGLGADRVAVVRELEKAGIDFIIFDDGFQNLKFKASFNLLLVTDAKRNQMVYRDFDSAILTSDAILHTKGMRTLRWPSKTASLDWEITSKPNQSIWLLCGVADPLEVAHFYRQQGVQINKVLAKKDHAQFTEEEISAWTEQARQDQCILAITSKDAVKLKSANFPTLFILKRKIKNTGWLDQLFER